jgi:hypothetical protein
MLAVERKTGYAYPLFFLEDPEMRTLLALASFGLLAALATGCTVVTSDAPLDAGDTGTVSDDGTDTNVDDTGIVTDTGTPDAPAGFGVIVRANDLVGGAADDIRDYGGGSTLADIRDGGRIAYAIAKYESGGTKIESNPIGNATSGGGRVDGKLVGLPVGGTVTITVTGYLRGLNGNNADVPMVRIPWATTTCTATPSATADVFATCTKKLELIPTLAGIVFTSDVLPADYCAGKGASTTDGFDLLRARTPATGTAVVSKTTNDCQGVIWVPETEFAAQEVGGVSTWRLAMEPKGSGAACSLTDANLCKVDRKTGTAKIDIFIVGEACRLTNASTGGTCF